MDGERRPPPPPLPARLPAPPPRSRKRQSTAHLACAMLRGGLAPCEACCGAQVARGRRLRQHSPPHPAEVPSTPPLSPPHLHQPCPTPIRAALVACLPLPHPASAPLCLLSPSSIPPPPARTSRTSCPIRYARYPGWAAHAHACAAAASSPSLARASVRWRLPRGLGALGGGPPGGTGAGGAVGGRPCFWSARPLLGRRPAPGATPASSCCSRESCGH